MATDPSVVVALVTAPDEATAAEIAQSLVEERLVACVNIVPGTRSIYRWEGRIEDSSEVLMLLKARERDIDRITDRVREQHPYEVPEVIATRVVAGSTDYLDWVERATDRSDD